jgi:hypothetical protein
MGIGKTDSLFGQLVEVWCLDFGCRIERFAISVAQVISQNNHYIGLISPSMNQTTQEKKKSGNDFKYHRVW